MPIFVQLEYQDELAVVKSGVRAESKNNKLSIFDNQGNIVASFTENRVLHWWSGETQPNDKFKDPKAPDEPF